MSIKSHKGVTIDTSKFKTKKEAEDYMLSKLDVAILEISRSSENYKFFIYGLLVAFLTNFLSNYFYDGLKKYDAIFFLTVVVINSFLLLVLAFLMLLQFRKKQEHIKIITKLRLSLTEALNAIYAAEEAIKKSHKKS